MVNIVERYLCDSVIGVAANACYGNTGYIDL